MVGELRCDNCWCIAYCNCALCVVIRGQEHILLCEYVNWTLHNEPFIHGLNAIKKHFTKKWLSQTRSHLNNCHIPSTQHLYILLYRTFWTQPLSFFVQICNTMICERVLFTERNAYLIRNALNSSVSVAYITLEEV